MPNTRQNQLDIHDSFSVMTCEIEFPDSSAVYKSCRGNCSGLFAIRICQYRHEFGRFLVINHMNSYRADMGASAVPTCLKESSEAT